MRAYVRSIFAAAVARILRLSISRLRQSLRAKILLPSPRAFLLSVVWVAPFALPLQNSERVEVSPPLAETVAPAVVFEDLNLDFVPKLALFLVETAPGQLYTIPAHGLSAQVARDPKALARNGEWSFAAYLPEELARQPFHYALFLSSTDGHMLCTEYKSGRLAEDSLDSTVLDKLHAELLQSKAQLADLRAQAADAQQQLDRLRADADVVGNLARIVDVREEIERQKLALSDQEKDIANLERLLKTAKSFPAPKNFVGRESQLTKQISELAESGKEGEVEHRFQASPVNLTVQEKLDLISEFGAEDPEQLQRELIKLRKERLDLEKRVAG